MNNSDADTIAAIATPLGKGGVGIIRVSGPEAYAIGETITQKKIENRVAHHRVFFDEHNNPIDEGIILGFQNPYSFTGEDVVEFQGHGGPVIMDCLLKRILSCGARLAKPGEFSERAFLNGKMDLAQAEAVADLINAHSLDAAKSAVRSLQGEFSDKIHALLEAFIQLRLYVEAAIDFPEEEIDFLSDGHVAAALASIEKDLESILSTAKQGVLLRDGMTVVLLGKPNAGKSSLLNALSGRNSAIVTEIPGTTRDVLREFIHIDGIPLHVIDTAGLRETDCVVEKEGVRRAIEAKATADIILHLQDVTDEDQPILEEIQIPVITIKNKIDLIDLPPKIENDEIYLSAKTGDGIALLKNLLKEKTGFQTVETGQCIARRRHVDALEKALESVKRGKEQLQKHKAGELLAEDLRIAQQFLGEITGEFTSDDLLGRIFSSFCIGK